LENHNKPMLAPIQLIQELTVIVGVKNLARGRGRRGKARRHSGDNGLMSCRSGRGYCKARREEVWIDKDVIQRCALNRGWGSASVERER